MDKINFLNGGQPAINDTNLNKMQENIKEEFNNIYNSTLVTNITWESGVTAQSSQENSIKINKIEKSCTLMFGVTTDTAKETSFKLGKFDSQYAPKKLVFGTAVISTNTATTSCQCSIGTDGSININNAGQSSSVFRGQMKWYY